jgi:hypothetical protein
VIGTKADVSSAAHGRGRQFNLEEKRTWSRVRCKRGSDENCCNCLPDQSNGHLMPCGEAGLLPDPLTE